MSSKYRIEEHAHDTIVFRDDRPIATFHGYWDNQTIFDNGVEIAKRFVDNEERRDGVYEMDDSTWMRQILNDVPNWRTEEEEKHEP